MWYLLILLFSFSSSLGSSDISQGYCHHSGHLCFWAHSSLYQWPIKHGFLKMSSYATLSASQIFWAVFHESLSKRYWLLLSYLRRFGGKQPFFIFCSQLSPFPGRDMSPEGAEMAIKRSGNTMAYLELAFPSYACFSHFLWDEFYPKCSPHPSCR